VTAASALTRTLILAVLGLGCGDAPPPEASSPENGPESGPESGPAEADGVVATEVAPVARSRELIQEAQAALEADDIDGFVSAVVSAVDLRPGHQTYLYYQAWARTLQGDMDLAFQSLDTYASMGLAFDIENDERLAPLREDDRFDGIVQSLAANRVPIGTAGVALTLPTPDLIPEGVAVDPESGTTFIGSVRHGTVLAVRDGAVPQPFAGPEDGLWSAMGMRIDSAQSRAVGRDYRRSELRAL